MQHGGKPKRVKLIVDLTRYNENCIIGAEGVTVPDHAVGIFGSEDRFVAIKFDHGAVMDITYDSLQFI